MFVPLTSAVDRCIRPLNPPPVGDFREAIDFVLQLSIAAIADRLPSLPIPTGTALKSPRMGDLGGRMQCLKTLGFNMVEV
ncbi:hypothetical protein [Synechococcus sp. PCC 7336]|uniref:hypothetical protein n=1 Tax=Synechococcus sp. PCC 7336 TaxID=195250 RepID=UPI00034A43E8|nr:hypothetical protein [Synechococcus sp. PCC 7336]